MNLCVLVLTPNTVACMVQSTEHILNKSMPMPTSHQAGGTKDFGFQTKSSAFSSAPPAGQHSDHSLNRVVSLSHFRAGTSSHRFQQSSFVFMFLAERRSTSFLQLDSYLPTTAPHPLLLEGHH